MKEKTFYILKCNFHTHFNEFYGNSGAKTMVDAHHDAGYDCIALTEHCGFLKDLDVVKEAKAYAEKKYGQNFIVITGEELNFKISKNDRSYGMDMIGLFLDKYIYCGWKRGDNPDAANFITAGDAFDRVHAQGGIGIIAHDNLTATVWHAKSFGKGEGVWTWDFRKNLPIDGWEIGNGMGYYGQIAPELNLMLSHPQESVDEGYIVMANSDAHCVENIKPLGICCTYLFVAEKTYGNVKEALLKRRTVADCNGELFGERRWVNLLRQERDNVGEGKNVYSIENMEK